MQTSLRRPPSRTLRPRKPPRCPSQKSRPNRFKKNRQPRRPLSLVAQRQPGAMRNVAVDAGVEAGAGVVDVAVSKPSLRRLLPPP